MIVLIEGPAGAGKTILMTRLIKKEWKKGTSVFPNFPLWFDENKTRIKRWYNLDETYHLKNGIIAIDESQKFLDARKWAGLPIAFTEKIAMHRHHLLDFYTTTQDMGHVDVRLRSNVHERFRVSSIFRFPKNGRVKPILQIIKYRRYLRNFESENQRVKWGQFGFTHFMFVSRFWTKTYYDTYGDVGKQDFICKIYRKRKSSTQKPTTLIRVVSRELLESGKARLR